MDKKRELRTHWQRACRVDPRQAGRAGRSGWPYSWIAKLDVSKVPQSLIFLDFRDFALVPNRILEYQYLAGVMGLLAMPIRPLLEGEQAVFGPEEITGITAAFEDALKQLGLVDRKDPVVLLVARTTIDLAKAGERDPQRLSEGVVRLLRMPH